MTKKKYEVVSLFTGCGGLDLGLIGGFNFLGKKYSKNNFEIIWANDIDENACKTFKNYFHKDIVCGDIRAILEDKKKVRHPLPGKADIVVGGFPCQDFSHAGKRKGFGSLRGTLYRSMMEVVKRTQPSLFIAENVKGLLTMNDGAAIRKIVKDFSSLGYHVVFKLLTAADYGVPQVRERVLIVGTLKKKLPVFKYPAPILSKTNWVSLKKALGDLENIKEGEAVNHFWSKAKKNKGQGNGLVSADKPGPTMRSEHHGNIEWHWNGKRRLSAREAARIQSFPDTFKFAGSETDAYRQIGNAIPPVMFWHIAKSVADLLKNEDV